MKKFNPKFLAIQILIIFAISLIVGIFLGINSVHPVPGIIGVTIFVAFAVSVFYFGVFGHVLTEKIAMKTERKYSAERGYSDSETFYSSAEILKVNVDNGKIAYIANQAYSLQSGEVMEAMSKADYFCEIIN